MSNIREIQDRIREIQDRIREIQDRISTHKQGASPL